MGHTLPESMFVLTGTVRPSWPRWGESPSAPPLTGRTGSYANVNRDNTNGSNTNSNSTNGNTVQSNNDGRGEGRSEAGSFGQFFFRNGPGGLGGGGMMRCGGGWQGGQGFLPGPWMIFRVAREDYLEFYRGQKEALDQVVGGATAGLEDMLC